MEDKWGSQAGWNAKTWTILSGSGMSYVVVNVLKTAVIQLLKKIVNAR